MNSGLPETHASIEFYDSDYPGMETTPFPENFDRTTVLQGLSHDVERYEELAAGQRGSVLELCCGTGRVAIPLARAGHEVTAVDLSLAMLEQLTAKLQAETEEVQSRVGIVHQDVTQLDLTKRDYGLVILPFNSLLCIPDFQQQCATLAAAAAHLHRDGLLVVDVVNPLVLNPHGDPMPRPFFTRRHPVTGERYTRFAAAGPCDPEQRQELYGWYDVISGDKHVRRTEYSMTWRLIFRFELELMIERAGMRVEAIEGGHRNEPFTALSRKMLVTARLRNASPHERTGSSAGGPGRESGCVATVVPGPGSGLI